MDIGHLLKNREAEEHTVGGCPMAQLNTWMSILRLLIITSNGKKRLKEEIWKGWKVGSKQRNKQKKNGRKQKEEENIIKEKRKKPLKCKAPAS